LPNTYHRPEFRPLPLDFTLLELMPEKGMIGGVHWRGRRGADLRQEVIEQANGELNPGELPTSLVMARIRSMHTFGLVESFSAAGSGTLIWARTPEGTEFLKTREEVLGT
jgi:hypothetical protein